MMVWEYISQSTSKILFLKGQLTQLGIKMQWYLAVQTFLILDAQVWTFSPTHHYRWMEITVSCSKYWKNIAFQKVNIKNSVPLILDHHSILLKIGDLVSIHYITLLFTCNSCRGCFLHGCGAETLTAQKVNRDKYGKHGHLTRGSSKGT